MARPTVSVVIASGAGGEFLFRCLESLRAQAAEESAEVIVVDRCGGDTLARLGGLGAFVRVVVPVRLSPRPSVPELRKLGVTQARGDVVAILEEHKVAPPAWIRTIRDGFRQGDAAIGGPILDNHYERVSDWVAYFSEYHNYLPPWPEGPRCQLASANIAYDRQKLLEHLEVLGEGFWEVVLHARLARDGSFRAVPAMGVYHTGPFNYGYYLRQRYLVSRAWGGTQRDTVGTGRRLRYLVGAPLFPFLLLGRIAQRAMLSGGHRVRRFTMVVPLLVPVVCAYVWGEWQGYLLGPGDALEHVE